MRPIEGDQVDKYFIRGQYGEGIVNGHRFQATEMNQMVDPEIKYRNFRCWKIDD